jgi:predicted nucleic acid-binding protein
MNLTVDASVVLCVLFNEPRRGAVVAATAGKELIAPASLDWEIGNAISAMFKRKVLELDKAVKALHDFALMKIERKPVSLVRAVQLSAALKIYAYDAYMIAVAEQHQCMLLSLDGGLVAASRRAGIGLLEVA